MSTTSPRAAAGAVPLRRQPSHPSRQLIFLKPSRLPSSLAPPSSHRPHPQGTLRPVAPLPFDGEDSGDIGDSASFGRKHNKKKREALHAVQWGRGEQGLDTPPPPNGWDDAISDSFTRYMPNAGDYGAEEGYLQQAPGLQEENGLSYIPDQVLVSNRAKQCITQVVLVVCSTGDEVKLSSIYTAIFLEKYLELNLERTSLIVIAWLSELGDHRPEFLRRKMTSQGAWKPSLKTIEELSLPRMVPHWLF